MSCTQPHAAARSRWTAADEARLQELTERKARIMTEARQPLLQLIFTVLADWHRQSDSVQQNTLEDPDALKGWVAEQLIGNADALRDALAPFDSGVRPGRSES